MVVCGGAGLRARVRAPRRVARRSRSTSADGARAEREAAALDGAGPRALHPDGRARRAQPRPAHVRRRDPDADVRRRRPRRRARRASPTPARRRRASAPSSATPSASAAATTTATTSAPRSSSRTTTSRRAAACARPSSARAPRAPHTAKIECEVDSLEQLDEALAAGADIVLLDNMPTRRRARGRGAHARARAARGLGRHHARARRRARAGGGRRHLRGRPHPLGARGRRRARLRGMKIPGVNADLDARARARRGDAAPASGGRWSCWRRRRRRTTWRSAPRARGRLTARRGWPSSRRQGAGKAGPRVALARRREPALLGARARPVRARAHPADRARRGPRGPRRRRRCARRRASIAIKWPNDVLVGGRKVAGVLVEAVTMGSRVEAVVIGIGINVHTRTFPDEIADIATSVALVVLGLVAAARPRVASSRRPRGARPRRPRRRRARPGAASRAPRAERRAAGPSRPQRHRRRRARLRDRRRRPPARPARRRRPHPLERRRSAPRPLETEAIVDQGRFQGRSHRSTKTGRIEIKLLPVFGLPVTLLGRPALVQNRASPTRWRRARGASRRWGTAAAMAKAVRNSRAIEQAPEDRHQHHEAGPRSDPEPGEVPRVALGVPARRLGERDDHEARRDEHREKEQRRGSRRARSRAASAPAAAPSAARSAKSRPKSGAPSRARSAPGR